MRSLLVSTYFPPDKGGISHLMASVAASLAEQGIACLTDVPAGPEQGERPPCPVYRRPRAFHGPGLVQKPALALTLARILWRERPEIGILASVQEGHVGLWLKRWLRLPYVIFAHGNEVLNLVNQGDRLRWPVPRDSLRRADTVIAVSHYTADLVRRLGVAPARIQVVHPGCDSTRFRPRPVDPELRRRLLGGDHPGPVLLTVGNLVARKGQDMVIRALPRVLARVPDLTYLVVGQGRDRAMLERLAQAEGVADRVRFAGALPGALLADIYNLGDLFVMPSRERREQADVEGFGLVYLEANACGKPVIGGHSGGVPDAIADGETGLLVPPEQPDAIATAILRLLTEPALARRLGQQGRERVVRDFGWAGVGRRLQSIFHDIVGAGTRGPDLPGSGP